MRSSSSDLVTDILYLLLVLGEHGQQSSGEQAGAVVGLALASPGSTAERQASALLLLRPGH